MKHIAERNVVIEEIEYIECDLCHAHTTANGGREWNAGINSGGNILWTQTEIMLNRSDGALVDIDLCPKCFMEMANLLSERGVIGHVEGFDE